MLRFARRKIGSPGSRLRRAVASRSGEREDVDMLSLLYRKKHTDRGPIVNTTYQRSRAILGASTSTVGLLTVGVKITVTHLYGKCRNAISEL